MENRSFAKKSDIKIILTLVIAALILFAGLYIHRSGVSGNLWAVVDTPNGQYRLDLSKVQTTSHIDLNSVCDIPATLEAQPNRCRVINVDCPDHICEGFGWLEASRQTATCMPNRFVVGIYAESELGTRLADAKDITEKLE